MKRILLCMGIIAGIFLAACTGGSSAPLSEPDPGSIVSVSGGTYMDIQVAEFQAMMETKDFPLINVHVPFEGDLPDTDLSIPFDKIAQNLDQLPVDKDAKIILYCRSGRMSGIAAETLVNLEYTNVYNLDGGFNAWQNAGLPLVGN